MTASDTTAAMPSPTWDERITKAFHAVERWSGIVFGTQGLPVLAGSDLAGDDQAFPEMPPSVVAWSGLCTAVENLAFIRDSFLATHRIWPSAQFNPLRAGLVGAAQTMWVLGASDQRTRLHRTMLIGVDDWNHQLKMTSDFAALTDPQVVADVRASVSEHLDHA